LTSSDRPNRNVNIRIDLASIRHNLKCVKHIAPNSKIMAVVKADAYGHGMLRVLPALAEADALAVATVEEGLAIRRTGEKKSVVVFQGYRNKSNLQDCIAANLWPVIHDRYQLELLNSKTHSGLSCWVKFDTGMHRVGLPVEKAGSIHRQLNASSVEVVGLMSHLACADNPKDITNERQIKSFRSIKWPEQIDRSMANSAALLSRKDVMFDWVRPGVMLYGANPFAYRQSQHLGLQPAMRVTAPVIAIRDVKRGERIGYGGRYQCERAMKVAVVGAGYGDGYPRAVRDNTAAMFGNKRCPIVGRVSMDSLIVDISSLTVPPPIDYQVTLWGHDELRVDEVADRADTIPYEPLCAIRGERQWIDATSSVNVRKLDQEMPAD